MLSVAWVQRSRTGDVIGQVMVSLALLSVIGQCQAQTGAQDRCAGGVCGSHDDHLTQQHDQPISDSQVKSALLSYSLHFPVHASQRVSVTLLTKPNHMPPNSSNLWKSRQPTHLPKLSQYWNISDVKITSCRPLYSHFRTCAPFRSSDDVLNIS